MNAIILAGGKGTRLMPLTADTPKPMLKIAGKPIIDYVVSQLAYFGLNSVVFSLGYMPEKVIEHASLYRDISVTFSVENQPLGTCGGVKNAERFLDDRVVILSGDCLSDVDIKSMLVSHEKSNAPVTMAVTSVSDPRLYGVVKTDGSLRVESFHEKPSDDRYGRLVNMGVYIIEKSVLRSVPEGKPYDFSLDLFPGLVAKKQINAYFHKGYWSDVGDKQSYKAADEFFKAASFYPMIEISDNESNHSVKEKIQVASGINKTAVTV